MFLLLFTGVGLGEIYVIKKPLYNPFFLSPSRAKSLPGTVKPSVILEGKFSRGGIKR